MNGKIEISAGLLSRLHDCARGLEASEWQELRALLAAPVVERKEPVAWLTKCKSSGLFEQTEPNEKSTNPEHWTDAFPVFAEQPAMVSVVIGLILSTIDVDDLGFIELSGIHPNNFWRAVEACGATVDLDACVAGAKAIKARKKTAVVLPEQADYESEDRENPGFCEDEDYACGWNACLDKVKELNQ